MIKIPYKFFLGFVIVSMLFFVLPVVYIIFSSIYAVPGNNVYLGKVEDFYETIQHPQDSRVIKRMKEVSHYGNSNLCDFLVGDFRESEMSEESITEWYESNYPDLFSNFLSKPYLEVADIKSDFCVNNFGNVCHSWLEKNEVSEWHTDESKKIYLILYADHSHSPDGDFRCH